MDNRSAVHIPERRFRLPASIVHKQHLDSIQRFSNILQGGTDALEGPNAAITNFHRFNLGVDLKPWDASVVLLDWHILFADNNNEPLVDGNGDGTGFSDDGCLRGNLFTAQWKVTHNKHMASTVTGEVFLPGDYYTKDRNDVATFARYEMMLTW